MFLGLKPNDDDLPLRTHVLSNEQMRMADKLAIEDGALGYDLMSAAGQAVANTVHEHYPEHDVLILCGPGNNGGDGFVAARFLEDLGHKVHVMSLVPGRKFKGDAKKALKDWGGKPLDFKQRPELNEKTAVIDAVFGTGLSKPLEQIVIDLFEDVRKSAFPVVAVDIPSGINGDSGEADPNCLKAQHTVTFFRKKIGHLLMPAMELCGGISVHDIGIDDHVIERSGFTLMDNEPVLWAKKLPSPKNSDHKYKRGHLVILGGPKLTGASRMSSEAAMRAGAGLCTIVSDKSASEIYRKAAAHVMVEELEDLSDFSAHLKDSRRTAVLLGPGAGLDDKEQLKKAVLGCLKTGKPVLLDADAISCFENEHEVLYEALHEKSVLTPHEGEFSKLFPDVRGNKIERTQKAAELTGANILLKGPDTIIARADSYSVVNTHATAWLATGGSGDVLAGIIAALLAQGMDAFEASCAGAWMHGEAGRKKGPGLVAPDIIEQIPYVLRDLT